MALPFLALALVLAAPPALPPAPSPAKGDPWSALRFLVGSWKAEAGGGKPGEMAGGGFSFAIDLDGKVAVRRSRAELAPAGPDGRAAVRQDLMVIYPRGSGLQAICWDDEGRVVRHAVRSEAGTVIFESEPGQPGPRTRVVYARRGSDVVEIASSRAPPGKGFQPPVTGLARRIAAP
jgi:hypothetical protein